MSNQNNTSEEQQYKDKKKVDVSPDWENLSDEAQAVLNNYAYLRIRYDTDIPTPVPIIRLCGEIISTEASITVFSGASKSGKSALAGWIIAGAISANGNINDALEGLNVLPNYEKKAVIHFDTEQARHKHQYNLKSIVRRANVDEDPMYYHSYNIRELALTEYQKVTSDICDAAFKTYNGIHLIVIDGIADYISDVNDQENSNAIIKYFEGIAIKYATPIIVIVHTNPDTEKERGHLGSQLQRKCESLLTIKQDNDISIVVPKHLRSADKGKIKNIQFKYDTEIGYHVSCEPREDDTLRRQEEHYSFLRKLANDVFGHEIALKDGKAVDRLLEVTNKGLSTVKEYLKDMRAFKLLIQGEDKLWRLNPEKAV